MIPPAKKRRGPSAGTRLKRLLKEGIVVCPGVFNPVTARLAEQTGFFAGYISGAGLHAQNALPDTGLLSREEVSRLTAGITGAAKIPFIVDGDTGFGDARAIPKTVKFFEDAGAAAIQIEDQCFPKRCGHLPGKELVPSQEMCAKIQAAAKSRRDKNFMIIARTDARGVSGYDDAVARAQAYVKAGADIIFPEALETQDEFEDFARKLDVPLMANMTEFGKSPYLSVADFEDMGYAIVIFPMTLFRVMMGAAQTALEALKSQGTQKRFLAEMQTRQEFYELIGYEVRKK
jgi:methylisocitrate lyase